MFNDAILASFVDVVSTCEGIDYDDFEAWLESVCSDAVVFSMVRAGNLEGVVRTYLAQTAAEVSVQRIAPVRRDRRVKGVARIRLRNGRGKGADMIFTVGNGWEGYVPKSKTDEYDGVRIW